MSTFWGCQRMLPWASVTGPGVVVFAGSSVSRIWVGVGGRGVAVKGGGGLVGAAVACSGRAVEAVPHATSKRAKMKPNEMNFFIEPSNSRARYAKRLALLFFTAASRQGRNRSSHSDLAW